MRKCPKCNATYDDSWKICLHCDIPLNDNLHTQQASAEQNEKGCVEEKGATGIKWLKERVSLFFRNFFIGRPESGDRQGRNSDSANSGFGFKTAASPKTERISRTPWHLDISDVYPPVLGIDLGTTTSLVATIYNKEVCIIKNNYGEVSEPSLVTVNKNGNIAVGSDARKSLEKLDSLAYSIGSIKRQMGKLGGTVVIHGRKIYPQVVSAMILAHLKKQAEKALGIDLERAVISVPANFTTSQREATKEAAELAGLKVLRITNEAVAAAVCYQCHQSTLGQGRAIVIDFGGGTLDITVLELGGDEEYKAVTIEVLSTVGDACLGGDDFTEKLCNYIRDQIKYTFAVYPADTYINRQRLWSIAEEVKKELSSSESKPISIPYLQLENGTYKSVELTISRKDFEELIPDLINKMETSVKKALADAKLSARDLDRVIVVGGTTRIPKVMRRIEELCGNKISGKKYADIDTAVVEGTALMGCLMSGGIKDVLCLDVVPRSIGIELEGDKCDLLIERNTTIPTRRSKIFTTTKDSQRAITVSLYEGESSKVTDNHHLTSFTFDNIPSAPRGVPQIEVSIGVDANGIILIEAKDLGTGRERSERMNIYSTLTQNEKTQISKKIKDYFEFNKMFDL